MSNFRERKGKGPSGGIDGGLMNLSNKVNQKICAPRKSLPPTSRTCPVGTNFRVADKPETVSFERSTVRPCAYQTAMVFWLIRTLTFKDRSGIEHINGLRGVTEGCDHSRQVWCRCSACFSSKASACPSGERSGHPSPGTSFELAVAIVQKPERSSGSHETVA